MGCLAAGRKYWVREGREGGREKEKREGRDRGLGNLLHSF